MMLDTAPTDLPGLDAVRPEAEPPTSVVDLIVLRVRLRAARRAAWLQHLLGDRQPDQGDTVLAAALDHRDTPQAEHQWFTGSDVVEAENRGLARVEKHLDGEAGARLRRLESAFRLTPAESDLLQTCIAVAADPDLGLVFAYLQRHPGRTFVSETLAARLFGHGRQAIWAAHSSLRVWGLVTAGEGAAGEPTPLSCDPHILSWLQGTLHIDPALIRAARPLEWRPPLAAWPVEETIRRVQRTIEGGSPVRVVIAGPPGSGRRSFAAAVARRFDLSVLAIDTGSLGDAEWPDGYMRGQRLAVLADMAVIWHGERLDRRPPREIAPVFLQFVACDPEQMVSASDGVVDHRLTLPGPSIDERRQLWRANVSEAAAWEPKELDTLATRYRLNVGDIDAVARRAPSSAREAIHVARELTRQRLGNLGRLLECPFTWDDLVLQDKLRQGLQDFAFEARDRAAFWESPQARRLFPRGQGLVGLFSGPPGTGKTMTAQIIAADLQLDLFRIDLATVVSKYIGETAKHLGQIFSRARFMNAVLLFDEADALFSKRTDVRDAHDRYANADTSYLLQLLEEYDGVVILASNKKQNIDPAFTRRVRYVFEFPRPEAAERLRIWRQVIAELTDPDTSNRLADPTQRLAETVEMSGAQVKNAALAAIFVARRRREPLAMPHLLRGVDTELGKEGRSLGPSERERLTRDG